MCHYCSSLTVFGLGGSYAEEISKTFGLDLKMSFWHEKFIIKGSNLTIDFLLFCSVAFALRFMFLVLTDHQMEGRATNRFSLVKMEAQITTRLKELIDFAFLHFFAKYALLKLL